MMTVTFTGGLTNKVVQFLQNTKTGDLVTYFDLQKEMNLKELARVYSPLSGARKRLEKMGIVFGTIRGEGIKRLDDKEIITDCKLGTRRVNRIARRTLDKASCVDITKLDNQSKAEHLVFSSINGAIAHMSAPIKTKKLTSDVASNRLEKLSIAETLEHFK